MQKVPSGWVLAAPSSNSGKTLVAAALLRLLTRKGHATTPFKTGPDYIDPGFLSAAAGQPCRNLDPWAMSPARLDHLLQQTTSGHFLIEGVMGLFDGAVSGTGSTADLAASFKLPIILVINARGQGASVAALAQGFANHRSDVTVAGLVFTNVGSARHRKLLVDACERVNLPVLGTLVSDSELVLQERHLGLVQASEAENLDQLLDRAADLLDQDFDLEAFQSLAGTPRHSPGKGAPSIPPLGQRIAVARDIAFGFCYPHVIDDWQAGGAEISFFSPLKNEAPDDQADAVYLPGGYPELHAASLAANTDFLHGLKAAAARDAVILGECGGYMVLGQGVEDGDGVRHAMAGLLNLETSFAKRRMHLGYRQASLLTDTVFGKTGQVLRGHEFHYASVVQEQGEKLYRVCDALGDNEEDVGLVSGRTMGSFIHLIDIDNQTT
jgi:cobyrinic acid a,c-diamide synthase